MAPQLDYLDRLLDPVSRALSPEAAQRLLALRADDDIQHHLDELATKANDGSLSDDERTEYESLVTAAGLIAILQGKARSILAENPAA